MNCQTLTFADVVVVEAEGRIDHGTAPAFGSVLLPQVDGVAGGEHMLVIDMSKVTYISSAGLRILMIAAKGCRKQKRRAVVAGLQRTVQEVFRIGRFDLVFEIYPTVRDALAALSATALAAYDRR
jgi:anti-anti-sigma factor